MPARVKKRIYYGWVIVAIFLVIQALLIGVNAAFTVFFKHIEAEFALSRTATSAISSVAWVLIPLTAFAGGWALDRYGPRKVLLVMGSFAGLSLVLTSQATEAWHLFFTYSVLLSMGFGAIYAVAISVVSRWFDKRRGLAVGIAGAGEGVGQVAMVPLSTFLIAAFDWKIAYLILGILIWVLVLPLSQLLKRDPSEIGLLPDGGIPEKIASSDTSGKDEVAVPKTSVMTIVKSRSFWIVVGIWLFFSFCMLMIVTHMVPHMTDLGISDGNAALVVGIFGGVRALGMISLGNVADRFGRKKVAVISTLIQVGAMVWLVFTQDLWGFIVFAVLYGLANGGLFSGITPIFGDTFGLDRLGTVLGLLELGWGAGAAIGPLVGGAFFDSSGSYTMAFILGAIAMVLVAGLVAVLKPVPGVRPSVE